jgi:sialate O-acetylesterase
MMERGDLFIFGGANIVFRKFGLLAAVVAMVWAPATGAWAQPTPGARAHHAAASKPLPFVSPIFGDNMVLQRGKANTIWGWSDPGDSLTVQVADKSATGAAGTDGRWEVKIDPPATGGPYTMKIAGAKQSVELKNVLVGDVWLCGGQSNMEVSLRMAANGDAEVKAANYPEIRFFEVRGGPAYHPRQVIGGEWNVVTPETAARISSVAYYFARRVQQDIHVPIGLVVDAVGGTPAESWASAAALKPLGDFDVPLAELARLTAAGAPAYGNYVMSWYDEFDAGQKEHWEAPDYNDSDWKTVEVPRPGGFTELGVPDQPAVVWFRKEVTLPDPLPSGRNLIFLGEIERMDTVYVNGTQVGASSWVENPRVYFLRPGVLKPGKNVIAVRVLKTKPDGGFMSKPDVLHLVIGDHSPFPFGPPQPAGAPGTSIPLAGAWKAKLSVDARPPHPLPIAYENWPVMPAVLYNGMLAPIVPLAITGAIWYQGEQNSPRGYEYRKILPAMIADWRKAFGQGDFPFYIVSLPAFMARSATPVDGDEWAETRDSQAIVAAEVPNSCLAVTIDTGEANNIHPKEKKPVGDRLARCALARYYHEKIAYQGPTFKKAKVAKDKVKITFAHTEGGLVVKGDKLGEFMIAGADRKWHWADARIEGKSVVVSSPEVPKPVAVRYAWQSNPLATLFNGAGLPAVPFRTDDWQELTQNARPY